MHGALAQVVALVSHGNAWLHGLADAAARLNRDHPTFKHVRSVTFRHVAQPRRRTRSVAGWFRALARDGALRLWVLTEEPGSRPHPSGAPAHQLVAFADAGGWAIGVERPDRDEIWTAAWKVVRGGVWEILYEGAGLDEPIASVGPSSDVAGATEALRDALERILAFAAERDVQPWARLFEEAVRVRLRSAPARRIPAGGATPHGDGRRRLGVRWDGVMERRGVLRPRRRTIRGGYLRSLRCGPRGDRRRDERLRPDCDVRRSREKLSWASS